MRIKIVSDGAARGTQLIDADTGQVLDISQVTAITWKCCAGHEQMATAVIELRDVPVEIIGEQKPVDTVIRVHAMDAKTMVDRREEIVNAVCSAIRAGHPINHVVREVVIGN